MTQREFYKAIIAMENVPEDVKAHAENGIAKLDASNARKASTPSKTQKENEPIIKAIAEYLAGKTEFTPSAVIAKALDITTNKAASLVKKIEGIEVSEVKYEKRKVNGYRLATEKEGE